MEEEEEEDELEPVMLGRDVLTTSCVISELPFLFFLQRDWKRKVGHRICWWIRR
jgi:hypothetical protein